MLKFQVEQLLLRGAHSRLLFTATLVGVAAIIGAIAVQATDKPLDSRESAVWWAFLRLTDPGYLGEDSGVARRSISAILTLIGYVLFMGSLIAILTQWLNQKIRDFERGLTPIFRRNHVLILGWTNRTPAIVEELMRAEGRARRFLRRRGARRLHVVILAEDVNLERTLELRRTLGSLWNAGKITFRSGTPLRLRHLERVDYLRASVIILPGAEFAYGSANESDTRIVKTLMSVAQHAKKSADKLPPQLVTEIFDPGKVSMAQDTYRGNLEVLASDVFIARCMAQNVRHPGLSSVFHEILSHGHGNTVFTRNFESFTGRPFGNISATSPKAILLGVIRPDRDGFRPRLNPSENLILESGDRLVFLARAYEDCEVMAIASPKESKEQSPGIVTARIKKERRVLILGWNHKVEAFLAELASYTQERFEVLIMSLVPAAERESVLNRQAFDANQIALSHCEGDFASPAELAEMNPGSYDNVVFMGSDWMETQEESDARAITGHLVLRNALREIPEKPNILVDLMDADNVELFDDCDTEVLVTPTMASHVLAQVALRRELNIVYKELFDAGGAEITFRRVSDYGITREEIPSKFLKEKSAACGEIVLGVRSITDGVTLNPQPDDSRVLSESDDLIVLVRGDAS